MRAHQEHVDVDVPLACIRLAGGPGSRKWPYLHTH